MPQKKQSSFAELRVGFLVLLSIAILILVIFSVSGDIKLPGFGKTTTVRTSMSSVDGLRSGAEVRLSGVKIGSIKDINFSSEIPSDARSQNNIEIIMEISGTLDGRPTVDRIRTDSRAVLKSAGVLGDNVIDITPGTSAGQPIKNGARIESIAQKSVGDIINASQTAVTNLNDISADIKEMTERLKEGKGTAGRFINDESLYLNLNKAILQAENLVGSLRQGEGTAGRLINDPGLYNQATDTIAQLKQLANDVSAQLNAGKGTVGKLYKDEELYNRANALVTKFDETTSRLDRVIAKVEHGDGTVGKLINDAQLHNEVRETIATLKTIAARLERGEGTAGLILKDDRLYNNLNNVSAEVTKLLYDFRQNPKKYLSIKVSIF
jgi:phospholipid/cholesterol/gamma-HCH transport system substrate-binding protein